MRIHTFRNDWEGKNKEMRAHSTDQGNVVVLENKDKDRINFIRAEK